MPAEPGPGKSHTKTFGLGSMVLFSVSAILVGDTIGSSASMGVQGLTYWVVLALLFFIPYGFVTSELGAAWPGDGGIYVWVKEALGPLWGTVTSWLYWVNAAMWAPSVFVVFIKMIQSILGFTLSSWVELACVLVLVWLMVLIGILPVRYSKWIPNVSAIVKIVIFIALGFMALFASIKNGGLANDFSLPNWIPKGELSSLTYLPTIIFSFMGFELMSSMSTSIKDPKRDVPKMILMAGGAILFIYLFVTFAILAMTPANQIVIETGAVDALRPAIFTLLGGVAEPVFIVVAVAFALTFVGNIITWSIGANESLAATGMDDTAPGVFGHRHAKFDTPDYAFYVMGAIATLVTTLTYVFFGDNSGVFWAIFTLSSVLFLLPYLLMFPSLIVLRKKRPDQPRPYKVPLGMFGVWLWAILCTIGIALTIFLFFAAPPDDIPLGAFYGVTVPGTIFFTAIGFILYFRTKKQSSEGAGPAAGDVEGRAYDSKVPAAEPDL